MGSWGPTSVVLPGLPFASRRATAGHVSLALLATGAVLLAIALTPESAGLGVLVVRTASVALPLAVGLGRLRRRPEDRFARILVAAGLLLSLTTLAQSPGPVAYGTGRVAAWVTEVLLVFLVLSFPTGRLEGAASRGLVGVAAVAVATLFLPATLVGSFPEPSPGSTCAAGHCPPNAFLVTAHPVGFVDDVVRPFREVLTVLVFGAVAPVVGLRACRAGPILRRTLVPVVAVALLRTAAIGIYLVARAGGVRTPAVDALGWAFVLSLPMLTLAFAGGLISSRLFVADALQRLSQTVRVHARPAALRGGLARALRDPSLELFLWLPGERWTNEDGRVVPRPSPPPHRQVLEVSAGDRPLAVIVHAEDVSYDRDLLEAVSSYVVTALENDQLIRDRDASLRELSESRARLVTAADQERRRIERDLHDGAQQRLVALQVHLELLAGQIESLSPKRAEQARRMQNEIAETLDELRAFGRGLYPSLLADRGLPDALHAVARSAAIPTVVDVELDRRYPRDVESAVYFSCLEALQNAAKHAESATRVSIRVRGNGELRFDVWDDGSGFDVEHVSASAGLTNLRDRMGAVGGTIHITSRAGLGTRVTGRVPLRAAAHAGSA